MTLARETCSHPCPGSSYGRIGLNGRFGRKAEGPKLAESGRSGFGREAAVSDIHLEKLVSQNKDPCASLGRIAPKAGIRRLVQVWSANIQNGFRKGVRSFLRRIVPHVLKNAT